MARLYEVRLWSYCLSQFLTTANKVYVFCDNVYCLVYHTPNSTHYRNGYVPMRDMISRIGTYPLNTVWLCEREARWTLNKTRFRVPERSKKLKLRTNGQEEKFNVAKDSSTGHLQKFYDGMKIAPRTSLSTHFGRAIVQKNKWPCDMCYGTCITFILSHHQAYKIWPL